MPSLHGAIAAEIDRLVWAVRDGVRAEREDLPGSSQLSASTFNPLINLVSFRDQLSESFIRRRYTYRPEEKLRAFFAELEAGGYLVRDGDRLVPGDRLSPVAAEIEATMADVCRGFWEAHTDDMVEASTMANTVARAGPERDGLLQVAVSAPESNDEYRRFWQRLSALRLLRNEAHVDAWRSFDLSPRDVEALTNAWAGSLMQAPVEYSQRLIDRGYVADGTVTDAGLAVRQQVEDATDAGVAEAFATIDAQRFFEIIRSLPPH